MPQFLKDSVVLAYDPSVLIPFVRILGLVLIGAVLLRLIDSALKRLRLIVLPGDSAHAKRVEQRAETLRHIIYSVSKVVIAMVLLLTVSSELGFNIGPVLASAGIAGLAIGFGAQSLVKDIISGFFILFEDQYGVGDVIRIGDHEGVVEHMTLRVTVLRNLEGQVHVVPNGNIQTVTVLTKDWARAVVDITVSNAEKLSRIYAVLARVGNAMATDLPDRVLDKPKMLGVERLNEDGITLRMTVKTVPRKQWDVAREWRRRIKEEFDREGIEIPQKPYMKLDRGREIATD